MFKKILIVFATLMVILGVAGISIYYLTPWFRTKEITKTRVVGTVTNTEYIEEYSHLVYHASVKRSMPHHHPAEFLIYVEYNEITETFDNEQIFKQYKKGDSIPLILIENIDKNGMPIKQKLELPE